MADVSNYIAGMRAARGETNTLGTTAVTTGERTRGFVSKIGTSLQSLGGQVGGTVGTMLATVGSGIDQVTSKAAKLSTGLEVGGTAALAAGIGLQELGSGAKQASDQLDAAIVANGESVAHYKDQIDAAVKSGENFDHTAEDTKNAIAKLIPATGSGAAALAQMGVVTNLAAKQHISLLDAATQVTRIIGGSGARTLVQYGIHMDGVGTKTAQGQRALEQLSKVLDGQASASVDNFGSQVDIVKTKVEDFTKDAAGPAGQILTGLGIAAQVAGAALEVKSAIQARHTAAVVADTAAMGAQNAALAEQDTLLFTDQAVIESLVAGNVAFATSADGVTTAIGGETAATLALDGAMDANPIGIFALALGGLAAIIGGGMIANAAQLASSTDSFTAALNSNTGSLNQNIRASATKQLLDDGSLASARKLGISQQLVVDAALGNASAQRQVNEQLQQFRDNADKGATAANSIVGQMDGTAKAVANLAQNIGVTTQGLKNAKQAQQDYNAGFGPAIQSYSTASTTLSNFAYQLERVKAAESSTNHGSVTITSKGGKAVYTGGLIGDHISHFAEGGGYQYRGPGTGTSDSIPAMVSDGEYINKASTVARLGVGFFQHLNQGGSPAPVYMRAPAQSGGKTLVVNVSLPISQSLIGNEDFLAKTVTTIVQKGVTSGVVSAGWNNR